MDTDRTPRPAQSVCECVCVCARVCVWVWEEWKDYSSFQPQCQLAIGAVKRTCIRQLCMHEDLWAVSDMFFGVDPFEEVIDQVYHLVDSRDIELRVGQHLSMSRVPLQHSRSTDTDTIIRLPTMIYTVYEWHIWWASANSSISDAYSEWRSIDRVRNLVGTVWYTLGCPYSNYNGAFYIIHCIDVRTYVGTSCMHFSSLRMCRTSFGDWICCKWNDANSSNLEPAN